MPLAITVITPPSAPAVSLPMVREHLRLDTSTDHDLLSLYLDAATQHAETYTGRALITQTLRMTVDLDVRPNTLPLTLGPAAIFPMTVMPGMWQATQAFDLVRAPLQAVLEVAVTDGDGNTVILAPADYIVETMSSLGRLKLKTFLAPYASLHVTYVAGYGDTYKSIPAPIRSAILLMTAYLYEHRGDTDDAKQPSAINNLLARYRLMNFGVTRNG